MSELIVIGHDSVEQAEAARTALFAMVREDLLEVTDAVVATVDAKGTIRLHHMVDFWTLGAGGGAFWGLLAGLLVLQPIAGMLLGATAGALSGAMTDFGIKDEFMREVTATLAPGKAALFVLLRVSASDMVIARLGESGGKILRTDLDPAAEDRLRATFALAHAEAAKVKTANPVPTPEPAV